MRIGVDIGGTFTDFVGVERNGTVLTAKTPSTPHDPSSAVIDGLGLLAARKGWSLSELLSDTEILIHGTTIATNSLIERKGAVVGMVTTGGFRDILELREGTKANRYDLRSEFPQPLIPRSRRCEVPERTRWDGEVEVALDEHAVCDALNRLQKDGVDAVVVGFLHSHVNPAHELHVRKLVDAMGWNVYVVLSHEVLGIEGEYDRFSTATVNAYVGPKLGQYLLDLERRLAAIGSKAPLLIMQSTGGLLPAGEASRYAVGCVTSGPAGGAMAAALFARLGNCARVVGYDMGGTSTDISLVDDGLPVERQRTHLGDIKISIPSIDIDVLALGGGSIARVDSGGILTLGPDSAGADPGPAAYGRGGLAPTLTDANLMLGYLSADTFLGGRLALHRDLAEKAIREAISEPLGLSVEAASLAVHTLASSRIAEGIRTATLRRGMDPRDLALISFGGAGGAHADSVAQELSIPVAIVPREASVFSALGFLAADVRLDNQRPYGKLLSEALPQDLSQVFVDLEHKMRARLAQIGFEDERTRITKFLDCRYLRQVSTIEIPVPGEGLSTSDFGPLIAAFETKYRQYYGHVHANESPFIETCRISGYGIVSNVSPACASTDSALRSSRPPAFRDRRRIFNGTWVDVPVYWFDDLASGTELAGLALIDSATTTILLQSGRRARVDQYGSLQILGEGTAP